MHAEGSIYSDHPHTPGSHEDSQGSVDQDVPETEEDEAGGSGSADDDERGRGGLGTRGAAIRPIRTVAPVVRIEAGLSLLARCVACPVSVRAGG